MSREIFLPGLGRRRARWPWTGRDWFAVACGIVLAVALVLWWSADDDRRHAPATICCRGDRWD